MISAFAFTKSPKSINIPQSDEVVNLLVLIPIYKEEREWCMKNHTLGLLEELNQDLNGNEIYADVKREMVIPEDLTQNEIEDYDFTIIFDADKETFIKLCEFIEKQEQNDVEITNELIEMTENEPIYYTTMEKPLYSYYLLFCPAVTPSEIRLPA